MRVTLDGKYETKDGKKVRIYAIDGEGDRCVHGAYKDEYKRWRLASWTKEGFEDHPNSPCDHDLVEVWQPKDKEPIWAWDDDWTGRGLRFWDGVNKCLYSLHGERNGLQTDDIAKVEHIEQWMIDEQKKLKD